jgi:selenocysteine-specific elongation factor
MPRDLILGTAGHIDHGKTTLIKALTGIDCDRLPQEKARGITIDIGFAHLDLGDVRLGIVDVPGHERFIRNMLAGVTGIDLALLIVAADDSVMPQTREHLDILKLLGVRRGVIALTKCDLVDAVTRDVAALEIRELVKDSFLAAAPVVAVSAKTGEGLADLREAILDASRQVESNGEREPFRLAIDRAFVVQGHGTVVTGSVVSGVARVGDELDWHTGTGAERVRIRGLNNHGQAVDEVHRGQRAAINLAGVSLERIRRGQELAEPGFLTETRVLTVRLTALAEARRGLKHRLPVRVHLGTAETMGTVSLLDADRVEPGRWALGQLFLDEAVTAAWGQPFVLRDSSAEHTLGGGSVLQPVARKIRRRHLDSIVQLEALADPKEATRLLAAAWLTGFDGLQPSHLLRDAGVANDQPVKSLFAAGSLVPLPALIHADHLAELESRILKELASLHAANPLATTHDRQKLLGRFDYLGQPHLVQTAIDRLLASRQLVGDAKRLARADFKPKLSANQRKLKDRIVDAHAAGAFRPPDPGSFAAQAGGNAAGLQDIYEVAVAEGWLVKVTPELYLHTEAEAEMRRRVRERLQSESGATVTEIKELLGTTRKFAVPLCEYLDRIGLTVRSGDVRTLK